MRSRLSLATSLLLIAVCVATSRAQTQYWDIDAISKAGAGGTTPSGVWSSTATNWNSNSAGTGVPTTWGSGNTAVFSAGGDATGTYTVSVSGTQNLLSLVVEEGFITQSGGTLTFGPNVGAISVASNAGWGQTSTGVITGTGGVVKSGAGVLALRGTNTFSKAGAGNQAFLTIDAGTVDFATDANLGAVPSIAGNAAALTLNGGTLRYSGTSSSSLAANRGLTIGPNGGTIDILNANTLALAAGAPAASAFVGSGNLTKAGDGRFRLQTAQTTFTGKFIVKGGSLAFSNQDQLGALPATTQADYFTLNGGGLYGDSSSGVAIDPKRGITLGAAGGYLAFYGTGLSYDGIISGTQGGGLSLSPSDAVSSNSAGVISLNAANTYNGQTYIGSGMTLSVALLANGGVNSAIGSSSNSANNLIIDGGTFQFKGAAISTDRNFTITTSGSYIDASGANNAALIFTNTAAIGVSGAGTHILVLRGSSTGNNTLSQAIVDSTSGATTLNKIDTGTWVLKNTANSYTGNTIVSSGGRLKLGASGVIPDASLVQMFSAATLDLNGFDETVRSISGTSGTIALGSKSLTLNNPSGEAYSATITASGGRIVKNGVGNLTLGTTTPYDGGVTLNSGRIGVSASTALGTGPLAANGGGLSNTGTSPLSLTNTVWLNAPLQFDDFYTATPGPITWNTSGSNKWFIIGSERRIHIATVAGGYGVTINQDISENGFGRGIIKGGNGNLTLNGTLSYTGNTTVEDGILSISKATLSDYGTVVLSHEGLLNLTFPANTPDTINAFFIDGIRQADGIWGAIGSGAQYTSALITGTGLLNVTPWVPPVSSTPLPGDFNNDGKVDGGDYVVWRKAMSGSNALLNDNGLGTPVGQAHYDLWRQHYGSTNLAGAGSSALNGGTIPEPAAGLLSVLGIACMSMLSGRRVRNGAH